MHAVKNGLKLGATNRANDIEMNELMAYKPVNSFTWSRMAQDLIAVITASRNLSDVGNIDRNDVYRRLHADRSGEKRLISDVLYLVLAHPAAVGLIEKEKDIALTKWELESQVEVAQNAEKSVRGLREILRDI